MAHDSDVARVAAALKAPGIRYKSFGNDPVRSAAQPVENVANSFPLLGAAMETAVAAPMPTLNTPVATPAVAVPNAELSPTILAPVLSAYVPPTAPTTPPRHYEPPPTSFTPPPAGFGPPPLGNAVSPPPSFSAPPPSFAQATAAQDTGGAGQFPFGAPPIYPEPVAPYESRGDFPGLGQAVAPQAFPQHQPQGFVQAPTATPQGPAAYGFGGPAADPTQNNYRLLESIGRQGDVPGQAPQQHGHQQQGAGGTFGSLLGPETSAASMQSFGQQAPQPPGFHQSGFGQPGHGQAGFGPPALPTGNWPSTVPTSALLPAAMVTLPLAEVMRLVAVGAPVVSSPFAAFRVSGGVPNSR